MQRRNTFMTWRHATRFGIDKWTSQNWLFCDFVIFGSHIVPCLIEFCQFLWSLCPHMSKSEELNSVFLLEFNLPPGRAAWVDFKNWKLCTDYIFCTRSIAVASPLNSAIQFLWNLISHILYKSGKSNSVFLLNFILPPGVLKDPKTTDRQTLQYRNSSQ